MRAIKPAKKDFEISMLPHNRFQLFWDIVRNRPFLLLKTGLLLLLFCLPFIVVCFAENIKIYDVNVLVESGATTQSDGASSIFHLANYANLLLVVTSVVLSIGVCGVCGIIRRAAWGEGVLFWGDFSKSVRENKGSFCGVAALLGICNFFLQYCVRLAYFNQTVAVQAAVGCCIVVTVIILVVAPYVLAQSLIYKLPFFQKISNAFLFAMRMPHYTLSLLAIDIAPYLLLAIDNTYVYLSLSVLLPIIAMPLQIFANMLICDSVLDRFVNREHFPQIYKKGMYVNAENRNDKSE